MSANLATGVVETRNEESSGVCRVVSIYEGSRERDLLVHLAHTLSLRFHEEIEFQFDWWQFKYLASPNLAIDAAHDAVRADLIFFASESATLPLFVESWLDEFLPKRTQANGAFVFIENDQNLLLRGPMRRLAARSHLDFLDSETGRLASVLSFAARPPVPAISETDAPMHWGINE